MGVEVTFIVRSHFLRADEDISSEFRRVFFQKHRLIEDAAIDDISYEGDTFSVRYKDSNLDAHCIQADQLLVATGIQSNADLLALGAY